MGRTARKKVWLYGFIAALSCLLAGACYSLGVFSLLFEPQRRSQLTSEEAPSSPIDLEASLSGAPPLNQFAELTCVVTSIFDAPNTTILVTLPKGFILVSGDLYWSGGIPENGKVEINAVIKAVKVGNWTIKVTAGYPFGGDSWYGDVDSVYVSVSENFAYISEKPFPSGDSDEIQETEPS